MLKHYYQDASCTIYHGDCRAILPQLPKVDLVLTDPPYGLGDAATDKNDYHSFSDDPIEVVPLVSFVVEMYYQDRLVMTPGSRLMFRYREPTSVGSLFFPAGVGRCAWGFVGWQPIFYYGKDPFLQRGLGCAMNSWQSTEQSVDFGHPCSKPIGLWSKIMCRTSFECETIIDPFMGSGTTLRAAKDLGRKAIGIELEERYCEIAAIRLQQEVLNLK